ncbi:triple tyrosine motif-containing protein [Aestuariivivens marinum]|uniref:triple tyrosine motif-containing protein n=1 Tax=Aestuariivivens marinum TaxID=2913555 RepID=UPI001F5A2681|nr:triple tyrosine motif-containing protein [Aestuariivivens marinum]
MQFSKIPFLFFLVGVFLNAQEHPPIEIYTAKDYRAETQNWSISQSENNYIYVANNKGLLEFNGATWQLYKSPNETIIRSVHVIDNHIYTGCNGDFGYWVSNDYGKLNYTSLSKQYNIKLLEDEEFWNIINIDDYILFQSLKRIYILNTLNKSFNIIESKSIIYKVFKVRGNIYFQETKSGLYKIENGKAELVLNDQVLLNNRLVNVFIQNENLLFETENDGFYIYNNNELSKWNIKANNTLSELSVFRSIKLKDGSFMLGTRSNGIVHLAPDGRINFKVDVVKGLGNNTVHWIFEDKEHNIWLALENGINCINMTSPFSIYKDEKGKIGTIYASKVYKDFMYIGTNQGLFYKPYNSNVDFKNIEAIQEAVWSLTEIDGTLFCGHDTGTSIVNGAIVNKIDGINQGTWGLKPIYKNKDLILQGNYNGLYVLNKVNGSWTLRNKIEGFDLSSRFFEIYDGNILVSHEYKGVFKLKTDSDFTKVTSLTKVPEIEKELHSSMVSYKNDLLLGFKEGVFKYDTKEERFIKDITLSQLFDGVEYTSGRLIPVEETNTLWAFSNRNLNYLTLSTLSGVPKINKIPLPKALPRGLTGYENIAFLKGQTYLIGTSMGYVSIDLDKLQEKVYSISINNINVHDLRGNSYEVLSQDEVGDFENRFNNVEFRFNVVEYDKYLDTEYQYQLIGLQEEWSNWFVKPNLTFENLPYGDYIFNIRGRTGNVLTNNVASYSFTIKRPWLLSNTMIAVYVFLILLFSFITHNIYKRYYRKQRERLLLKSQRELELKELENKQQLMRFNNDKLRQDIDNKNRELGISTMSLIKKNEFLNSIKSELQNINDLKKLKHVIKVIDRNINNTDDWNLFEEAFNNADKDFLKKIKQMHPELTSNDLRLCAYLRLNLSSKEIAPLLNISPRSVEVKRYRLRKKMDLPHESSLSDYILEI